MTPERAAETVLDGIERDRERILVGADAHVVYVLHRLMPVTMRRLIAWGWRRRWADAA